MKKEKKGDPGLRLKESPVLGVRKGGSSPKWKQKIE